MAEALAGQVLRKIGEAQATIRECLTAFDESDRRVKTVKEAA